MELTASGEFRGVCRLCHGGCAARLVVEAGTLTAVRPAAAGQAEDALPNRGRLCAKGLATPDVMHHPDRLRHPLKREGPPSRQGSRGAGQFRRVSWDEALDAIATRLDAIRRESGPESIALGQGTGRPHYFHVIRFANSLGTPNWYEPGLANCFIPRISVSHLTYGGFPAGDYYGDTPPRTILFWGHNPLVSSADGEMAWAVDRALRRGARGVAVDPRRSETARRCDLWLPIRPGTDQALALAMLRAILTEGWADEAFLDAHATGVEALRERVAPCTPAWAEAVTGVPAASLLEAAARYATEKPAMLDWGVSIEQNPRCLQTVRAVALLRAVTGNLDQPGSDVFGQDLLRAYPVLRQALSPEQRAKRIGAREFPLLGGFRAFMPSAHIPGLFRAMREGVPYRVRALLLAGANPLLTVADSRLALESLQKLDFLVAMDHFLTPSAALADYVLPAAFWPEMDHLLEMPLVAPRLVCAQRAAVRVGECRQIEHVLDDLALRLGLPGAGEPLEAIFDHRLEPAGLTFAQLVERGALRPEPAYRRHETAGFRTPSGKVEIHCKALERQGFDPLPTLPEIPPPDPDLEAAFPCILTTGARRREYFHSDGRQIERLRSRRPHPLAELHPALAARHGIADGDWIEVRSPAGAIRVKALVHEGIREEVVSVDHGWWFPERPGGDVFASNANVLTSQAGPFDPAFGSYLLRGGRCAVALAARQESG